MLKGNDESNYEKLPTFRQWCKTHKASEKVPVSYLKTVWFPNEFDSYSLDTESFRLRIASSSPLYEEIGEHIANWIAAGTVVYVVTSSAKDHEFEIHTLEGETSFWEELGDKGYRCKVNDKKLTSKRKKT